ncbi:MAG: GNAT family protein [Oscillospiraceae bacterium]
MNHKGTILIETERLILRKFRLGDSPAAFRNWTSDDNVTKFLRWPTHPNSETTEKIIKIWVESYEDKKNYLWAIVPKNNDDEPVGTLRAGAQNEELGIMHIGYCIGSRWWNKGITSEAFGAIIPFLFDEVKANRIESQHDPLNPNSGKVMTKCGLTYEGTLRKADISNRGIVDAAIYSLLADEYRAK